jgi:hypothetical protein
MLNLLSQADIENQFLSLPLRSLSASEFVSNVLSGLIIIGFVVGAVAFLFMFIIGGIRWISSGGDKAGIEAARGNITSALVGLVILFSLFAIVNVASCFFGTTFTSFSVGGLTISGGGSPFCPDPAPPSSPPPGEGGESPGGPPQEEGEELSCKSTWGKPNANCPCGGPSVPAGYCARTGQCAIGPGSNCYVCTSGGWVRAVEGSSCSVITCQKCP